MEWGSAIEVAKAIRLELQPACERIEIGGSLRRLRAEVKDIEIIAMPRVDPFNQLDLQLVKMVNEKHLVKPLKGTDGKRPPYGQRYKKLLHPASGLQVDLFSVLPPEQWGIIFALRTGSREFSIWLVTRARRMNMYVEEGQLHGFDRNEQPWRQFTIPCPDEESFLQALGLPWIPPQERERPPAPNLGLGPIVFGSRIEPSMSTAELGE